MIKKYKYIPQKTCSKLMEIEMEDNIVKHVKITAGCPGNTVGVSRLAENRNIDEVISLLKGIPCGVRGTSCPDQLATALELIKNGQLKEE